MQVSNALNNYIRILFNPKVEHFRLFDFLIVKSEDERYLAQIVEIYDDKFDASQNVAKLKLFYKISNDNEVIPYDNFTPNKECEITKINQAEVENFINQGKETFQIGLNVKNSSPLNVQYDFFNNNPLILSDKLTYSNAFCTNLLKNLSTQKHTVIIDTTGVIECVGAKKVAFGKNFRLPLNSLTIDYIFEKCLSDTTLELQTSGLEILNEIKKFVKKQPEDFIPFTAFANVIEEQYKATSYPELRTLLERIKKYQIDEIFARTKKDSENPFKAIENSASVIVDISSVNAFWQKTFIQYLFNALETEAYVMARINEENFDVDLINFIYNKKKNISFIPTVSYSYKKLPTIIQYCYNYVLMPSLSQRNDFLDANFALCNMISNNCIMFGKNTDDFLYMVKNYELKSEEIRPNYKRISLTGLYNFKDEEDSQIDETSSQEQRAIEELDSIRMFEDNSVSDEDSDFEQEVSPEIFEDEAEEEPAVEEENEIDDFEGEAEEIAMLSNEDGYDEIEKTQDDQAETFKEIIREEVLQGDELQDESLQDEQIPQDISQETESQQTETQQDFSDNQNSELSEEQLDFFEAENTKDDLNLSELAQNSVDKSFNDIISKNNIAKPEDNVAVDENTRINLNVQNSNDETLPIFNDDVKTENSSSDKNSGYKVGDVIVHKKYGKGAIVKTIKYENRQLLQIQFENSGKKLLDPKVADIKTVK